MKIALSVFISCLLLAQSTESRINYDEAGDILNKMLISRNKMRNLQFEYEEIVWRNLDVVETRDFVNPNDETIYGKYRMVLDCNGLGKKDYYEYGVVDSSGKKIPMVTLLRNISWDGHIGLEHNHHGKSPGGAILDSSPPDSLIHEIQPWNYFTGFFVDYLAKAIDEGQHPVSVEILPDGKYQVGYLCSANNSRFVSVIDPEKGFTCSKLTSFRDGAIASYITAEYKEFSNGVWFPVTGEDVIVTSEGVVTRKSTFKMSNIKINDSDFSEDLFYIDLPEGTRVTDKVQGIRYIVSSSTDIYSSSLVGESLPDINNLNVAIPQVDIENKMILMCFFDMLQQSSRNCILQLSKRAQELKAKDVVIVAVLDSKIGRKNLDEWIKENNIDFPMGIVEGNSRKIKFSWGVKSLPWLILTNKKHVVVAEGFSIDELDEKN